MIINFLMPLKGVKPTKTYELDSDKKWIKTSDYPAMKYYKGIEQECSDLKDFYDLLKIILEKSVFFIHGEFIKNESIDMNNMLRRSKLSNKDKFPPTIKNRSLELFAIDVDNYESDLEGLEAIENFIAENLPSEFSFADYVYQFSSSYKLTSNKLKVHLFFTPKFPIYNLTLHNWSQAWNKMIGKQVIDPSIYTAVQPIYTMKRIISRGKDPVDKNDFIGYVNKGNNLLNWEPSGIESVQTKNTDKSNKYGNLFQINLNKKQDYDISESISKIMTSKNYHDQIRNTALSLINKNVSRKNTIIFLKEFMLVAKNSIKNDSARLVDWKDRFDDIERAVNSAVDIVDNPEFDIILDWIRNTDSDKIRFEFKNKLLNFEGVELKALIKELDLITDFGIRAITEDIKNAKIDKKEEIQEISRKIKTEERNSQGIFELEITSSTYGSITTNICKILANSNKIPEVYKIGTSLSIIESSIPKTIRQITKKNKLQDDYPIMPIIHDISSPVGIIRSRVEKDCIFINEVKKEIICPDSILNAIPNMYGIDWNPLSGIVEHPFINDKWELVEKEGYDKNTGLYSVLHKKLKIKLIDPKIAYNYMIDEVLAEFPFQSDLDRIAAIGMFMTAVQRAYVTGDSGMPGFAMVSPKPSSGKTTLAQLLSYSIYNRPVAATGWSDNDEELGKHLLAILREGHSCVLFDNIKKDGAIKSNELAKAMTSGTYSRRKLGSNETEEVPSSVLWLFTGNNIVFKGDFATRILPIRIVPTIEKPESRKFNRHDIGQWAMDNRKKIISAILSIVIAGKDIDHSKLKTSSRFKEWNNMVRIPLLEVSGHDLMDLFERNDFMDDEGIAKGDFLKLLFKTFKTNNFTTKDIMKLIEASNPGLLTLPLNNNGFEFKHCITEAFNEKAVTNIKTLGRFILGMKDFIIDGLMLIREEGLNVAKWKIIEMDKIGIKEDR